MIAALAIAGAVAAECLAYYTLAELVGSGYDDGQHAASALTFVVLGLAAYGWPRAVPILTASRRWGYALTVGGLMLALYAALRIEFAGDINVVNFVWLKDFVTDADAASQGNGDVPFAAMLLIIVIVRAAYVSGTEIDLERIPRQVGVPFVLVTAMLVLGAATQSAGLIARAGAAFYAFAVLALAFSQLGLSGASVGTLRAGGITAILMGGIVTATLAALAVFALLFGLLAPTLGPMLSWTIEHLVTLLLTPPAWLLDRLFRLLSMLGGPAPQQQIAQLIETGGAEVGEGPDEGKGFWSKFAIVTVRIGVLVVVALAITGVVALVLSLRRRNRERAAPTPGHVPYGSFADDARSILRSLFRRERAPQPGPTDSAAIRLYRQVLASAEHRGHGRPPARTANEFAPTLADTFRDRITDEITAAFQEARYAAREPDAATLADLEKRWHSLPST